MIRDLFRHLNKLLLFFLFVAMPVMAQDKGHPGVGSRTLDYRLFIYGDNGTIGTSYELMARGTSYVQIAANDSLKIVAEAADSVRIHLVGIRPDSSVVDTIIRVIGTDTVRTRRTMFAYWQYAVIDSGKALTDTLHVFRSDGTTKVTQINIGQTTDYVAHFIPWKKATTVLNQWSVGVDTAADTVWAELRWYYDVRGARAATGYTGYRVIDRITLPPDAPSPTVGAVKGLVLSSPLFGHRMGLGFLGVYVKGKGSLDRVSDCGWK